jgi:hypothetical protein
MYRRRPGHRTKMSVSLWKRSLLIKRIVKDQLNTKEEENNISNGIAIEEDRKLYTFIFFILQHFYL